MESVRHYLDFLSSSKVKERKTGCQELGDLLENPQVIEKLKDEDNSWNEILEAIIGCLQKDIDKIRDTYKKKQQIERQGNNSDLFCNFIRIAVKSKAKLNLPRIVAFLLLVLSEHILKECYELSFLKTLANSILADEFSRSRLKENDWEVLFGFMKTLCVFRTPILESQTRKFVVRLKCLLQIVKWGPLATMSPNLLRQEFAFVTGLCRTVSPSSLPAPLPELLLEIVQEFIGHTAKDNRMACCKLGEEIFGDFREVYDSNAKQENKLKVMLIDFFLLQLAIHHPNDVAGGHTASYAFSQARWRSCLSSIRHSLMREVEVNEKTLNRNLAFFVVNEDDVTELSEHFVLLFVGVCRQIFEQANCDISQTVNDAGERPAKRARTEVDVKCLIEKIKTTKFWAWINVTYALLEAHPSMIEIDDYLVLLQSLTLFQVECKDPDLRHHLYKALQVLDSIQDGVAGIREHETTIKTLWSSVGESTLRSIGLNRNNEQCQQLLQRLLNRTKIITSEAFYNNYYKSGVLNVSTTTIATLNAAFRTATLPDHDSALKIEIVKWILGQPPACLTPKNVAEFLINLIPTQWPEDRTSTITLKHELGQVLRRPYADIESVYWNISLENLILHVPVHPVASKVAPHGGDKIMYDFLIKSLLRLNDFGDLQPLVLVHNVLSCIIEHGFLPETEVDLENFELYRRLTEALGKSFGEFLPRVLARQGSPQSLQDKLVQVGALQMLMAERTSSLLAIKLRTLVPDAVIQGLVSNLNCDSEDAQVASLKLSVIRTLTYFACIGPAIRLHLQDKVLKALVEIDLDYNFKIDVDMTMTFFAALKTCNCKCIDENTILSMYNILAEICEVCYSSYNCALRVLDVFCDIYPLVVANSTVACREQFQKLLHTFIKNQNLYGPALSVKLLKCIGIYYEMEPFKSEEIIKRVPEYLISNHQEVRLQAVNTLARFFEVSTRCRQLQLHHQQEMIFHQVTEMGDKVFVLEGNFSNDRIVDETVTRTSSVLHTYASIMATSTPWTSEALFALLKIASERNFSEVLIKKILTAVSRHLGYPSLEDFLKKELYVLMCRWKSVSSIDKFPYKFPYTLYGSPSLVKFYAKFWKDISSIVIDCSIKSTAPVAEARQCTLTDVLVDGFPNLLAFCVASGFVTCTIQESVAFKFAKRILGEERITELCREQIDQIILELLEFVTDAANFNDKFTSDVIFPKGRDVTLTVEQLDGCMAYLSDTWMGTTGTTLMLHLLNTAPGEIQTMLLRLNAAINNSRDTETKLKYFHVYSILVDKISDEIRQCKSMQHFFVRDLTYTLIHFIKQGDDKLLSRTSCTYLDRVLRKLLPDLATIFQSFIPYIVRTMKKFDNGGPDIPKFLLVDHYEEFKTQAESLEICGGGGEDGGGDDGSSKKDVALEEEIEWFLDLARASESLEECEDGLVHLRESLTGKKDELGKMYERLRATRGFSEDCQDSPLHRLICLLIELGRSANCNMSTEAVRCLGEVGVGELSTLVLRPEKQASADDRPGTPWELVSGHVISLLGKYVVDADVNVIAAASDALRKTLRTKEGRKVAEAGGDFGHGPINSDYLTPFFSAKSVTSRHNFRTNLHTAAFTTDAEGRLWRTEADQPHDVWITRLVCSLLRQFEEEEFFAALIDVCQLKVEFCETLLPLIVFVVMSDKKMMEISYVVEKMGEFFDGLWDATVVAPTSGVVPHKASVQAMLNVVHFVRLQKNLRNKKSMGEMNLDYLKVAKAAQFCMAHFTALLYSELWCQEMIDENPGDFENDGTDKQHGCTKLDLVQEKTDPVRAKVLQDILRSAYKAVGEIDALSGCGTSYLLDANNRIEHYKEQGKWDMVLHHYAVESSLDRHGAMPPLMDALKQCDLYEVAVFGGDQFKSHHCEIMWRMGHWSCNTSGDKTDSYEKYHYQALKALHDKDRFNFSRCTEDLRAHLIRKLVDVNLESSKNFYQILGRLQSLKELEDFTLAITRNHVSDLLAKWRSQDAFATNDFNYIEPIKAQRIVLLKEWYHTTKLDTAKKNLIDLHLEYAGFCRLAGKSAKAQRTLAALRRLTSQSHSVQHMVQLEEARLHWDLGDVTTAKCLLRHLCANGENIDKRLHALALKTHASWLIETPSESRQTIINLFTKSFILYESIPVMSAKDDEAIVDSYDQLAKFTDRQYQQVSAHINSELFKKKIQYMEKIRRSVPDNVNGSDLRGMPKHVRTAVAVRQKQTGIDKKEIENVTTERDDLLKNALKYYLLNITQSDAHNVSIFRVVSLLLDNRSNDVVADALEKLVRLPSYKFVDILPQIVPHISGSDRFAEVITEIIEKCASDHPYHTLPLVLALANGHKDQEYSQANGTGATVPPGGSSGSGSGTQSGTQDSQGRTQSAKNLLGKLKKRPNLSGLLKKMENLSEALIELAYYRDPKGTEGRQIKLPGHLKINKIKNDYDDVLLPTCTLKVQPDGRYTDIVGIANFSGYFYNVGGLNMPKRVSCVGTDGKERAQLVKGQDDLRQDAVMQQVFTIMNSLLRANEQTKDLFIRTYKVVPLSMRSGVLEWVANSMPLSEFLTGDVHRDVPSAHEFYFPKDKSPAACRREMKAYADYAPEKKLTLYRKICQSLRPVMHKFFETSFPQPCVWYERRRAYTHSVATSSMCGYILGLGDRHCSNILIDKTTAEVIHIDFGIAFEQGRVLPTPETVPFRLTRDVVDGMGVSGVEGVFRKSCEKTMDVLRSNSKTIITILEVLLYDPLYEWTVSTAEAKKRQRGRYSEEDQGEQDGGDSSPNDVNLTAERALLRLEAKLLGTESGNPRTVEHQVGALIQQAVDPANLCRVFNGWQPFL